MKRNLLFLFLVQFIVGGIYAQNFTEQVWLQSSNNEPQSRTLGYSDYMASPVEFELDTDSDVKLAISIPESRLPNYANGKLTRVFIYAEDGLSDVQLYIGDTYDEAPIYTQNITLIGGQWNEIVLNTPFIIPSDKAFVIGYSASAKGGTLLGLLSGANGANCHIGLKNAGSTDNYQWGTTNGLSANIAILGSVERDDYSTCNINFAALYTPTYNQTNKPFSVNGRFYNRGTTKINSLDVTYKVGDNEAKTITFSDLNLYHNFGKDFEINDLSCAQEGTYPVEITFSNINGGVDEDIISDNTKTSNILFANILFGRKHVAEEATGTWCSWCPRGAVALAYLKENYPDSFIGIAVHGPSIVKDPMTDDAYILGMNRYGGSEYPKATFNRDDVIDPGNIPSLFEASELLTSMRVTLYGDFVDDTKKQVKLTAAITSALANPDAQYKLAFAVIENDVTGTGDLYNQLNSYSDGRNGEMGGFEKLPNPVPADQMVYQEVARGIFPFEGINGSVPTTLNQLEPVTFDYTVTVPSSVNDVEKTEYIVMLLDAKGKIVNADKLEVSHFGMGINDSQTDGKTAYVRAEGSSIIIDGEFTSAQIYDAMGRLVKSINNTTNTVSANNGLYIVKVTNGNKQFTEKVIVR
ncbi:thiol-disulfide isomerase/thioredoxin [Dysgonomonas sp. PH5-45]|uniref:T9SS type A sorting domain-containing protein n=1 Tax=unclassified Dysgonomonas TaxID=2630389 RepID=UPI0024739932|nr:MULTISPECIES: T9SS type A sorting domain-containing protein [unclassified Dysgonomonas]MDH6353943.1 thiol-disulfide isomerase/thioredoxin [Dysgonomonas sp. PH5-45]MDH6386845.1 thiol-disulfide isomerase/thioredoxin [Dysgonomonas sp. PH5-37]